MVDVGLLTGRAGAPVVGRDADTGEVVQSSNARSSVEADIVVDVQLTATRRSTVLGHANRSQRPLHQIHHQRSAHVNLQPNAQLAHHSVIEARFT